MPSASPPATSPSAGATAQTSDGQASRSRNAAPADSSPANTRASNSSPANQTPQSSEPPSSNADATDSEDFTPPAEPDTAQSSAQPSDEIDFSEEESSASQSSPSKQSTSSSQSAASNQSAASSQSSASSASAASAASASRAQSTPANSGPILTAFEQAAILEGRLEASIADYDGMILREREYILSRGNQKGSEEDLAGAPSGRPYDEAGEETEGTGGTPYDEPGIDEAMEGTPAGGPAGGEHNRGRKGDQSQRATAAPPADIPDGSDDDVVARQIREAATQERDPELREKLWEEYRKYKQSI